MKLGFFTVFRKDPQHYVLGEAMIRSVRATMPGVQISHLTDETSAPVSGVDCVLRKANGPMLERRLEHYAVSQGEWLLIDTDVMVKQDVRDVFKDEDFDVALPDRAWKHLPQDHETMTTMPFNTGVVFSRKPAFWELALAEWRAAGEKDWMSEQRAVYKAVRSGKFKVKILPGMKYNYPPKDESDPCKGVAIAHYKGARKKWMK